MTGVNLVKIKKLAEVAFLMPIRWVSMRLILDPDQPSSLGCFIAGQAGVLTQAA